MSRKQMEYYSVIKRKVYTDSCYNMMKLESMIVSERSQMKKATYCMISSV